jgi:hypothetical protein
MNIKEYWAKLVASGLAPDWENVLAVMQVIKNGYFQIAEHYQR